MRATQSREKLRDMLGADIAPDKHVSVPSSFVSDFEAVAIRYRLHDLGEYAEAKQAARGDMDAAIVCFEIMAKEVV